MASAAFETRHNRTTVNLPDIFRTSGGLNFGIGPTDRLRDADKNGAGNYFQNRADQGAEDQGICPRIILKDQLGKELDTFTTLQEAIYRAKWNVKKTGNSREPLEWRLPKAPPPARPDYTRVFPPVRHHPLVHYQNRPVDRNVSGGHVMEFDVEDVGFVKESLQYLPYVPSLSFLRQEILVGPKTYFQIVGTMLLHQKILSPTEKRQAIYNFPGFCSGCSRMGLCYGCERSSELHYHHDRKMKTGGGFTYFKKDKAQKEIKSNNPSNWKIKDPNRTLKRLMEDYAGVDLEGPISDQVTKLLDKLDDGAGNQDTDTGHVTGSQDGEQEDEMRHGDIEAVYVGEGHPGSDLDLHDDGFEDDLDLIARYNAGEGHGDFGYEERGDGDHGDQDISRGRVTDQHHLAVPSGGLPHILTPDFGDKRTGKFADGGGKTEQGLEHRLPKYRKTDSQDEQGEGAEGDDGYGDELFERRGRRRERLYKAPTPFKPKKSPSRKIEAKSPFSTNRKLSLPTGRAFQVKKSDKPLTQFDEFKTADVSWKEPKKFELKETETKTTKFWSGSSPGRRKEKKYERKARSVSPPRRKKVSTSPRRARSPDSGIESGTNADSLRSGLEPIREDTFTPTPPGSPYRPQKMATMQQSSDKANTEVRTPQGSSHHSYSLSRGNSFYSLSRGNSFITGTGAGAGVASQTGVDNHNLITEKTMEEAIHIMSLQSPDSGVHGYRRGSAKARVDSGRVISHSGRLLDRQGTGSGFRQRTAPGSGLLRRGLSGADLLKDRQKSNLEDILIEEEPTTPAPVKREIVKKEKKAEPKRPKPRTPSPPPKSPSPIEDKPPSRELSFVFIRDREPSVPKLPDLPPIEVPALPEIKSPEPEIREDKPKPKKMLIEVTPELTEPPKKLRGPPKLAPRIKPFVHMRRGKVAEAPVTSEELQEASDPLDFLAKYCIINPDRIPYYERVFLSALSVQTPRYNADLAIPPPGMKVRLPPAQLSSHEMNMLRDLTVLSRVQSVQKQGMTTPEQYLEKLNYSIEFIQKKQDAIADKMAKMQGKKTHYMAELAKMWKPEIARLNYKSKTKSKRKKKKKPKLPDYDTLGAMSSPPKDFQPRSIDDITDEVIVSRMDDKMRKKIKKDPRVQLWNLELKRDIERLKNFDERLNQIDDEKDLVSIYCTDYYFNEQVAAMKPVQFKRQQSALYQRLNPDPDAEMNIEEVEAALQQINNRLITEKEFQYIYFILNLPRREKINFRLFCIIAALSEKVSQMDPFIRKLMNKVDYNALDVKMEKSKELFGLLQDGDMLPPSNALASDLSVELTAGGLTPEHVNYVLSKFNREGRGFVDFLDFVTYVPLFIEIHKRIIEDPFNVTLDI